MRAQRGAHGVVDGPVLIDSQSGHETRKERDSAAGDGREGQMMTSGWSVGILASHGADGVQVAGPPFPATFFQA